MEEVKLQLNENQHGAFSITGAEKVGEMVVSVSGKNMIVYHTEVSPKMEGRGLAKQLLSAMVAYARDHKLKVTPLCPFVHAQFKRHPNDYADIWNKDASNES